MADSAGDHAGNRPRKAVVVATQHWKSPFRVGSHHFASALRRRGFEVLYVSAPLTPLHGLRAGDPADRRARWSARKPFYEDGVLGYVPFALIAPDRRPILRWAPVVRHWWRSAVPPVRGVLQRHGFERADLLYCDNPYQGFWKEIVPYRRFVFRVPDDLSGLPGVGQSVAAEQQRRAAQADRVVFAGHELQDRFPGVDRERAMVIPNGVSIEAFAERRSCPAVYDGLPRPVAIYVGALDDWFDAATFRELARLRPDVTFLVVGPPGRGSGWLDGQENVVRLGGLPFEEVVGLLQHADVGLIPFDVRRYGRLIDAVHPLKLYEYMAAGLPVVTVNWAELEHLQPPVEVVEQDAQSFAAGIDRALSQGAPREKYQEFLAGASWQERLQPLFRYLDEELQ